jgi:hypothetical protein
MVDYLCGTCFQESECPHWTIESSTSSNIYCFLIRKQSTRLEIKCYCGFSTSCCPQKQTNTYHCQSPMKCTNQLIYSSCLAKPDRVKLLLKSDLVNKVGRYLICNDCKGQGYQYDNCTSCNSNYWKRIKCQSCDQLGSYKVGCPMCHSAGQIWHIY